METRPEADLSLDLDPEALAICQRLAGLTFPWDITRALELALLKTFCLPSISGLLCRTGEFVQRPRKRYDDTGLMVAELLRHGPDSPTGTAVIDRMNRIHGSYAISTADYVYVLSGFVAEPIRWLESYGWRPLTSSEQQALFRFWRSVGGRMGITGLPATLEELLNLNVRVEATLFQSAPSNRRVADATLAMLLAGWPGPLRRPLAALLRGLLEPSVATSLGWTPSPAWLQQQLRLALRARSRLINGWQCLRPPRASRFYSERPTPSYGTSFQLEQLGPPPLLERLNQPHWTGRHRRIGLTGGIASGKSSVGRLLRDEHGLPLLDADVYAHEALAAGTAAATTALERYGDRVRNPRGEIDRAALGRIVFTDPAERAWLEGLIHPLVRARFAAELERLTDAPAVVLMIPLLFEAGLEGLCSEIWLVDCGEEQQLRRLIARDGLTEAEAGSRIEAQWPLARKRPLADVLIDNRGTTAALVDQVARALAAGCPGGGGVSPAASR